MKSALKLFLILFFIGITLTGFSQVPDLNSLRPNPEKEKMFSPYVQWRHGWTEGFADWKSKNTMQYYKELWYFSESFYVKRNYLAEGITLNESIIDISRFEASRKENEEAIVTLPGFKDVLVLLPASKLIYNPETAR
jgi:hypothetical protein